MFENILILEMIVAFSLFNAFDAAIEGVVNGNVNRLSPIFPLQFFSMRDYAFETKFFYKFDTKFLEGTNFFGASTGFLFFLLFTYDFYPSIFNSDGPALIFIAIVKCAPNMKFPVCRMRGASPIASVLLNGKEAKSFTKVQK